MTNTPNYGVVVGRFQVPELHDGHIELFRVVTERHRRVIVFLGVHQAGNATRRNPLDFETRRRMIQAKFPEFSIHPLLDKRTDAEWSRYLDLAIRQLVPFGDVTLYGSRDSFVPHYHGSYIPIELGLRTKMDGTSIREMLTNTVMESYDFRAGVIYGVNNSRPRIYSTVDIAPIYYGPSASHPQPKMYILLGRKSGCPLLRFIGGFVEANSESLEDDATREVYEETGLEVADLRYVCSRKISDWRYPHEDQIKTILFVGRSMTLGGKAADDIAEIVWMPLEAVMYTSLVVEHQPLLGELKSYLERTEYAQQFALANR